MLHDIESSIVVDISKEVQKSRNKREAETETYQHSSAKKKFSPTAAATKQNTTDSNNPQQPQQLLGEVLGRYAPFFSMYNDYIANYHKNVLNIFSELEEKRGSGGGSSEVAGDKEFVKDENCNLYSSMSFTEYCSHVTKNDTRCRKLNLKSFLIMPIQRVPRYVLLLQELVKQINKVLQTKKNNRKGENMKKTKKNRLSQEAMFYIGLENEIKSIEKALETFKSVARRIDSKITEVSSCERSLNNDVGNLNHD